MEESESTFLVSSGFSGRSLKGGSLSVPPEGSARVLIEDPFGGTRLLGFFQPTEHASDAKKRTTSLETRQKDASLKIPE